MKKRFFILQFLLLTITNISFTDFLPNNPNLTYHFDAVVVGGGIGGLSSSIYLARAGYQVLVLEGPLPGGALAQSPKVQNWPGEIDIPGHLLLEKIKKQALSCGVTFSPLLVQETHLNEFPFKLKTNYSTQKTNDPIYLSCNVAILAAGTTPCFLNIPGEKEFWGKGVYNCAVCDGLLYKNKKVAVVGGGDSAIVEAHYLCDIVKEVYLFVRGNELKSIENERLKELLKKPNIKVFYNSTLSEIRGSNGHLTHVDVKQKEGSNTYQVDAVFLAIGNKPNSGFLNQQLSTDDKGFIKVNNHQQTSIKGVYAVGDIADPIYQQAISAAGDGAKAALNASEFLKTLEITMVDKTRSQEENPTSSSVKSVETQEDFMSLFVDNELPVIVDFYADWCGPCQRVSPKFEELASLFANKIKFAKLNIDKHESLVSKYQIRSIPYFVVFDKTGAVINTKSGSEEFIELTNHLKAFNQSTINQIEDILKVHRNTRS
ncbi:MAG: FAD-dependent oxidoreductase [Rhabdochlamydiaceae bacterium]